MKIMQIKIYNLHEIKQFFFDFITQRFINVRKKYIKDYIKYHDDNIMNEICDIIYDFKIKCDTQYKICSLIRKTIEEQEKETNNLIFK